MRNGKFVGFMFLIFFIFSFNSQATIFEGELADFGSPLKLFSKSSIVLLGTIETVENSYIFSGYGIEIPYSSVSVQIENIYRGFIEEEIFSFYTAGGERPDGSRLFISDQAIFREGEQVIIFYNGVLYPYFGTVGGNAGVYRIVHEGSENLLLDYHWRPIIKIEQDKCTTERDFFCQPDKTERGKCSSWEKIKNNADIDENEEYQIDFNLNSIETLTLDLEDIEQFFNGLNSDVFNPSEEVLSRSDFLDIYSLLFEQ
jgi:hypothetical protein